MYDNQSLLPLLHGHDFAYGMIYLYDLMTCKNYTISFVLGGLLQSTDLCPAMPQLKQLIGLFPLPFFDFITESLLLLAFVERVFPFHQNYARLA